jgi:hypothetical protein
LTPPSPVAPLRNMNIQFANGGIELKSPRGALITIPDGRVIRFPADEPPKLIGWYHYPPDLIGWYHYPPELPRGTMTMTIDFGATVSSA